MANEENLKPFTSEQSREKAVINGRRGGIASGKSKREKKAMKDTLSDLLSMPLKSGKAADVESIQSLASVKGKNITVHDAIMIAMLQKAMAGNVKAAEYIRDTIGEKPKNDMSVEIKKSEKLEDIFRQIGGEGLDE